MQRNRPKNGSVIDVIALGRPTAGWWVGAARFKLPSAQGPRQWMKVGYGSRVPEILETLAGCGTAYSFALKVEGVV